MTPNEFQAVPPLPAARTSDERMWALIAHVSAFAGHFFPLANIIAPLVIWQMKKDTSAFVRDHALESLNAQISISVYAVAAGILFIVLIGMLLLPALLIANAIFIILAAFAANEGRTYRYPFIFRLVK